MLPKELSYADRFALAREAGFEAIEMQTITKDDEAAEIKEAAKKTGSAHSFGHEHGSLAAAAVEQRPGGRFGQREGHGDVVAECRALGRRHRACLCRRSSTPKRRTGMRGRDRSASSASGCCRWRVISRSSSRRGGLEQIPAEPDRVCEVRRRLRVALAEGVFRRRQRRASTRSRRTGSARSDRASSRSI